MVATKVAKIYSSGMTLDTVRQFFSRHAPDIEILVTAESSATVALAAAAHKVEPVQIAKTIGVQAGPSAVLIVMAGTARLDNRKFRDHFGVKPRMLGGEDVTKLTGHPVGGVCPFGLHSDVPVFCDISLRALPAVIPAAGAANSAVRISPERMAELTNATWVDVCQGPDLAG